MSAAKGSISELNTFLKHSRSFRERSGLHIVMGNESCDLDSIISSIFMAFLRSRDYTGSDHVHFPLAYRVLIFFH